MTKLQQQALRKGTQIAVYEIKEVLGINQSEITYRAWNEHLNATVIVKEFFPFDYVMRDESNQTVREYSKKDVPTVEFGLNNFIQQNEKLLGIQHPGVQSAHNVLGFNHTAYLAVEDEKGALLSEQLEKFKSFNEDECRMILTSLLNSVINYDQAGIIHGDIYPGNILIKSNGKPTLINFAGAWHGFAEHVKMLTFQLHAGFSAPEQYQKDQPETISTDLFGIGATLYRCITQINPIDSRERVAALEAHKPDPQKSALEHAVTGFSSEFLQTIDWMLQIDTKLRPQSVNEVLTELNKENKNLAALEAAYPEKIEKTVAATMDYETTTEKMGLPLILTGMIGSVLLGSLVLWLLQKSEINPSPISETAVTTQIDREAAVEIPLEKQVLNNNVIEPLASIKPMQGQDDSENLEPEAEHKIPAENNLIATKDEVGEDTLSESEQTLPTDSVDQSETVLNSTEELVQVNKVPDKQTIEPDSDVEPIIIENKVAEVVIDKENLIDEHMAKAEENFAAIRLTTPIENNAYQHYQAVLAIEPDHKGALTGLRKIVDFYLLLIDKAITRGDANLAEVYLTRAKSILPDSPYIQAKSDELSKAQQESQSLSE